MKKTILVIICVIIIVLVSIIYKKNNGKYDVMNLLQEEGYVSNVNNINIIIPSVDKSHTYLVLNDSHIWADANDSEIMDDWKEVVRGRVSESFLNANGIDAKTSFSKIIQSVDLLDVDGLILNSDIIDQMTVKNLEFIKSELDKVKTPYIYLRSDHDIARDWTICDEETVLTLESDMNVKDSIYTIEEEGYIILGINDSWENITAETLERIKEVFAKGKPIIIFSHVPYMSMVDEKFLDDIVDGAGRYLVWGEGCYYQPDENMKAYLDMVYADDSPVVAVVSAHLHRNYTVKLTDTVTEYILAPFYEGNVAFITITGVNDEK